MARIQTFGKQIFGGSRFGGPITIVQASWRSVHTTSRVTSFSAQKKTVSYSAQKV